MRELCSAKYEALWANGVPYELIKNTDDNIVIQTLFFYLVIGSLQYQTQNDQYEGSVNR